jgi:hypothetical protein
MLGYREFGFRKAPEPSFLSETECPLSAQHIPVVGLLNAFTDPFNKCKSTVAIGHDHESVALALVAN